jgi:hypothetical protein
MRAVARTRARSESGDDRNQPAMTSHLEDELCTFVHQSVAELKRHELRTIYAIGSRIRQHKALMGDSVRASLTRCGERLGKNRTTLLRYAFVSLRIKPDELEELIQMVDPAGLPPAFWDLVEIAPLARDARRLALEHRLGSRCRRGCPSAA